MRQQIVTLALAAAISATAGSAIAAGNDSDRGGQRRSGHGRTDSSVQLGPRPFFLVNDMEDSRLKRRLLQCSEGPFTKSDFSIGHRGAALQFPEHTRESYEAAARMGAGIVECDVTERSGILADGNNGFYYQTFDTAITREGDVMKVIHALARDVGILGVFSDWPAAVTYYANCTSLR